MNALSAERRFPLTAVLLILLAALALRAQALWMPHWRGDQAQYVILAMKLSHAGLNGYNLRGVSLGHLDASPFGGGDAQIKFNVVKPGAEDAPGAYLAMMKSIGQAYYDEPLHVRAPLFPAILALSHKILSGGGAFGEKTQTPTFAVLSYGPRTPAQAAVSYRFWRHQLWAALVPLAFNLGLIFLTAVLAWILFGSRQVAVMSAAILASNPVSIWLAHKILTEDTTVFFAAAAVTAFTLLWRRNRALAGLASGLLAGATVLANQRTGLILPALGGFAALYIWQDTRPGRGSGIRQGHISALVLGVLRLALDPFFWLLAAGFLAVTGFWFWKVIQVYGHPLYQPGQKMAEALGSDMTGWFAAVHARPHPSVLFSLGAVLLCPLFGFAAGTWNQAWGAAAGRFKDSRSRSLLLLWLWPAVFFFSMANLNNLFGTGNQEHRYFYAAYPALAILSAFGLGCFQDRLKQIFPRQPGCARGIVVALILASAAWGCRQAYVKILADQMLF